MITLHIAWFLLIVPIATLAYVAGAFGAMALEDQEKTWQRKQQQQQDQAASFKGWY